MFYARRDDGCPTLWMRIVIRVRRLRAVLSGILTWTKPAARQGTPPASVKTKAEYSGRRLISVSTHRNYGQRVDKLNDRAA